MREICDVIISMLRQSDSQQNLKSQLGENRLIIEVILNFLFYERMNISDATLIGGLKALAYAVDDDPVICQQVLACPHSLNELFDFLNYPHKGIKIQVSSILASLLNNSKI